jgi:hypothetical protein
MRIADKMFAFFGTHFLAGSCPCPCVNFDGTVMFMERRVRRPIKVCGHDGGVSILQLPGPTQRALT